MSRRFEPGTALIVELSERPKVLRHLLAHVIHATPEANGRWIIGCTDPSGTIPSTSSRKLPVAASNGRVRGIDLSFRVIHLFRGSLLGSGSVLAQ
jgi:hypothetical protein